MALRSTTRTCPRSSNISPRPISTRAVRPGGRPDKREKASNAPRYRSFPPESDACLSYSVRHNRRILAGRTNRCAGTGLFVFYYLLIPRRRRMAKGTVKWFNPTKGYGFIQPATGGKDIFVHISAVQKAGLTTLNEGQSVEYEEVANRGKTSAENLKV